MEFDLAALNTGGGGHPFVAEHGITDPNIIRFNSACPPSAIEAAMDRLAQII